MPFLILFLHITTMFAAVTANFGFFGFLSLAERTGQTAIVRAVGAIGFPIAKRAPILFIVGGFFGLLTAISFGFNLLSPWLVIAYLLFTVALLTGIFIHRPFGIRLGAVVPGAPDGPISGALAEVLADPRERAAVALDTAVVVFIVFDMVVKPFS